MSNWWDDLEPWADDSTGSESGGNSTSSSGEDDDTFAAQFKNTSAYPDVNFDVEAASYRLGLMVLAVVFILVGVSICFLLGCVVPWATRRRARLAERSDKPGRTEFSKSRVLLVLAVLALAAEASTIGGLSEVEKRMGNIEDATQSIVDALKAAVDVPDRVNASLNDIITAYEAVEDSYEDCPGNFSSTAMADADEAIEDLEEGVMEEIDTLEDSGLDEQIQGVTDAIFAMRYIRHAVLWPTVALCAVLVGVYLCIAMEGNPSSRGPTEPKDTGFCAAAAACCSSSSCYDSSGEGRKVDCEKRHRRIRAATWVFASILLVAAAFSAVLRTLVVDFCSDLDENLDIIADTGEPVTADPTLDFYTGECSGSDEAVDVITEAQEEAADSIGAIMDSLTLVASMCDEISEEVEVVDSSLEDLWEILDEGTELVSCETISGVYRSVVWDDLCGGLSPGLMVLLVSCTLLFVLLLLLWTQWNFMLQGKIEVVAGDNAVRGIDESVTPSPLSRPVELPMPLKRESKTVSGYGYRTESPPSDATVGGTGFPAAAHLNGCHGERKQEHDYQDRPVRAPAAGTAISDRPDSLSWSHRPREMVANSMPSTPGEETASSATGSAAESWKGMQHTDHWGQPTPTGDSPVHGPVAAEFADARMDSMPRPVRPRETVGDALLSPPWEEGAGAVGTAAKYGEERQHHDRRDSPVRSPATATAGSGQRDSSPPPHRPRGILGESFSSLAGEETDKRDGRRARPRK